MMIAFEFLPDVDVLMDRVVVMRLCCFWCVSGGCLFSQ